MRARSYLAAVALAGSLLLPAAPDLAGTPAVSLFDGAIPCVDDASGVRFCEGGFGHRVESFDGVPIDVNVTLPPAAQAGPFPLILSLHGWGGSKDDDPIVDWALDGYVVVSPTARGFHGSCGSPDARANDPSLAEPDVCETRGWVHLADARFEARDFQHLAGVLADEGWAIPDRIAATGGSYGGGLSLILAVLRDRVMLPDGSLVPWQSPGGLAMEIAGVAALIPWSDLAASLQPNGSTLDGRVLNPYGTRGGVVKSAWVAGLFLAGQSTGYFAPAGVDPAADLIGWEARLSQGEPYDADPFAQAIAAEIASFHSAYGLDDAGEPAPSFIYNAWTDDLFPADEAIRFWRKTASLHPGAEIALYFDDNFGHPRAGLSADASRILGRVDEFFARHLEDVGGPLPGVETFTQACGGSTAQGPFVADDWDALRQGEVRFASDAPGSFDESGGDPDVARELLPLLGPPCRTVDAVDHPGSASWLFPAAAGDGYTLMGSPRVIASLGVAGAEFAQVASRLWDVAPDGTHALITHDFYRPRSDDPGPQVFELHPNGWHFAAGHAPKLELLGQSDGVGQPSAGPFRVEVRDLELRLPVLEAPDGGAVQAPLPLPDPIPGAEPPQCPPTPLATCTEPTKGARLAIRAKVGGRDKVGFSWKGDGATTLAALGAGAAGRGYALCLYDAGDGFAFGLPVPTSGTCNGKDCCKAKKSAFRFKDRRAERTGARSAKLQANGRSAKLKVQGRADLVLPAMPLPDGPVTVQLVDGLGGCFGAALPDVRKNDAAKLDARSD